MIDRTVTTIIDREKCTGCGLCVQVCPSRTISIIDNKALVTGDRSLNCGHCAAVCPVNAVQVAAIDDSAFDFETFQIENHWLPPGKYNTQELVRLMHSRRSCRNFSDRPVDRRLLEDLVKTGISAPSGTNSQKWTFTILPSRTALMELGRQIGRFFHRLNRLAAKPWLRRLLKAIGKPQLDQYYRDYYDSVQEGLTEWEQNGRDRLFHGASAGIVVGSRPGASCPMEDAMLATGNMLLAAHSMGLGTCLVGFAVSAMGKDASIKQFIGIPEEETVYSVIALGYPAETYQRLAGRKKPVVRVFEGTDGHS